MRIHRVLLIALIVLAGVAVGRVSWSFFGPRFNRYQWTEVNPSASWDARAGLQAVVLRDRFFLMGGRTPLNPEEVPVFGASKFWSDVWMSKDEGKSWTQVLATEGDHWKPRAYFKTVTKGRRMYVLGGQDFTVVPNPGPQGPPLIGVSEFFNDVWSTDNGVKWRRETDDAGWAGRAGLSAATYRGRIYVMGGSFNDDPAIIGGPPEREFFNDVWCSGNGRRWRRVTEHAPWSPRAGARTAVKNGRLYLFGGEVGFTCDSGPQCPPFFNDVWCTKNGRDWKLVTPAAPWSPRPGHEVVVVKDHFVLFGGFGLGPDPFAPANPMDVWVSRNGADWWKVSDSPWNATDPAQIKYDFAALAVSGSGHGHDDDDDGGWWSRSRRRGPAVYTFGGDRETFNPFDPFNYLNVDHDVWRYSLPTRSHRWGGREEAASVETPNRLTAFPNPVRSSTRIQFELGEASTVDLSVFDASGRLVRRLAREELAAGAQSVTWDARDESGRPVPAGVYFYRMQSNAEVMTRRLLVVR